MSTVSHTSSNSIHHECLFSLCFGPTLLAIYSIEETMHRDKTFIHVFVSFQLNFPLAQLKNRQYLRMEFPLHCQHKTL